MSEAIVSRRPAGASRRRGEQRRLRLSPPEEPPVVRRRRPERGLATGVAEVPRPVPPPVFHPLGYRSVVAGWPLDVRERWGRRANEWEDRGLSWRDAETQAFVEVWHDLRRSGGPVG